MPDPPPWYAPIIRALRIFALLATHTVLVIVFIGLFALVKAAVRWLGDPTLFGVSLTVPFDVMEAVIVVLFIVFGVLEAYRVFRG
jgi:hypothetical protein